MKRILVTGGTTFVSKCAVQFFVNAGHEVYVLNRNAKPQVQGVYLIEGDRHHLENALKGYHFDVVADITAYDAAAQDIPQTIPLDQGLNESAQWYIEHEAEVKKKPFFKFIDKNLG